MPVLLFYSASRQESWEDSELFKPQPSSDVDALGKKRYIGECSGSENWAENIFRRQELDNKALAASF